MIPAYFHKTELDEKFYDTYLKDRLPCTLLDAHQHLVLKKFTENVDPSVKLTDWANQCYDEMSIDDMDQVAAAMFPGKKFTLNALTTVSRGSDFIAANAYLASLIRDGRVFSAMMTLDPKWSDAEAEKMLVEGGFVGFKPYPDLVSGVKGADIGMFDFIPHSKLAILNRNKKAMTLHIPRAKRLSDPRNVDEIKQIHDRYPDIKLIIAHFGRSYSTGVFEDGVKLMGDTMREINFDMAAVLNPAVLRMAFEVMDPQKILWGTDLPVFLWHGRRHWTEYDYFNLAREDFPWNKHEEGAEIESGYTFFLYEQLKNILDEIERLGGGDEMKENIFHKNAERILRAALKGESVC